MSIQQTLLPELFVPFVPLAPGMLLRQIPMEEIVVRALSWKQPYCSLMLPPHNKVETRVWHTKYRGWVLMCASQVPYSHDQLIDIAGEHQADRIYRAYGETDRRTSLPYGVAIGIGLLVDCYPMQQEDEDNCFVEYNPKLFCHVYENVHPIMPIPWKGKQGWSTVPKSVLEQIIILPSATASDLQSIL